MNKAEQERLYGSEEAQIERALNDLNATRNGMANVVCFFVCMGQGNTSKCSKAARISLAADKGYRNLLERRIEGR